MIGWMSGVCAMVGAYFLGAIPNGLLVARIKGVDIRRVGSGNIGATNVFRSVGKGWGLFTFALDALKGFVPAFFFPAWAGAECGTASWLNLSLACGCAAIAGHNWPVYLKFKGGKGVATSAGVLLGVAPIAAGIGLASWAALLFLTGYVAIASMGAGVIIAASSWMLYRGEGLVLPVTLTVLALVVIYTHRSNIQRLRAGTEHRFRKRIEPQRTQRDTEEGTR